MPARKPINLRKTPTLRKSPARQSKRVTDRIKATRSLLAMLESARSRAAKGFSDKLADELRDGEVMPDQGLALDLVGRSVKTALELLVKADDAYCGQATQRQLLAEACRYVASDEIYPELVEVRREIDARFGKEAGGQVHAMKGRTPRQPKALHLQLEGLVMALKGQRALPQPLRPGPPGERAAWLARLETGYMKLTTMLEELQAHEIRDAALRQGRDFELESFDVVYGEALDFARAVLQLGGCAKNLTWHLLPTVQQRKLKRKARQESDSRAEGLRTRKTFGESA